LGRFEGISDIRLRPIDVEPDTTVDLVEPSRVVEAMASAVDRVRRMATNVFKGDAALFADRSGEGE
jgi:hypothetical protein